MRFRFLVAFGVALCTPAAAQTPSAIGPTFGAELQAAGCPNGVLWSADGTLTFTPGVDPSCAQHVFAAHDPTRVPVPAMVTRLQGRLALSHAGLLAQAESAIAAAGGDLLIWYTDAQTWRRDDPHILAVGVALTLTTAQIDALFIAATTAQ